MRERIVALHTELTAGGLDGGPVAIAWHLEREGLHAPLDLDDPAHPDDGAIYTARFTGGHNAFEYLLAYLGTRQKNGAPGHPQTQGKIERFHQTLKRWLGQQPGARTIDELQAQLDAFRLVYDEERPHRAIGRMTPAEADQVRPKAHPTGRGASGHFRLRHDFVDRGGQITLRRAGRLHHLGIGAAHARRRVLAIVDEHEVTVVDLETGEVLSSHLIEPDRSDWRNQRRHVSLLDRSNPRAVRPRPPRAARRFSLGPRDERTHAGRTGTALATAGCSARAGTRRPAAVDARVATSTATSTTRPPPHLAVSDVVTATDQRWTEGRAQPVRIKTAGPTAKGRPGWAEGDSSGLGERRNAYLVDHVDDGVG